MVLARTDSQFETWNCRLFVQKHEVSDYRSFTVSLHRAYDAAEKVSLTLVTKRKVSTFTEVGIAVTIRLRDRLSSDSVVLGLSVHILKYL